MKRILIFAIIALFIIPAAIFAAETELEKIPSPEQIKYFKVIKKENGALFGIKLDKAVSTSNLAPTASDSTVAEEATLEKISGPWDLQLFQKIKKVGNALWGYRKDVGRHLGFVNSDKKEVVISPETRACLKSALNVKDNALKATVETAKTKHVAAIEKRNTCQISALEATSSLAIMKDFKACAETFKQDIRTAQKDIKDARKALQDTYKESLRACYKANVASSTVVANPVSTGNVLLEDLADDLEF